MPDGAVRERENASRSGSARPMTPIQNAITC